MDAYNYDFLYNYNYDFGGGEFSEVFAAIGAFFAAFMLIFMVLLTVGVVMYVIQAVGLHTLSKSRDVNYGFLVWIPFLNLTVIPMYIIGKLIDEKVKLGSLELKKAHIWLPIMVVAVPVFSQFFNLMINIFSFNDSAAGVGITIFMAIIMVVISVAYAVLVYAAYYRLFKIYATQHAVLYLVLSIFFSFLLPIFIFVIRNNQPQVID
jgi:hypothetical protein